MNKHNLIMAMELSAIAYQNQQPQYPGVKLTTIDHENGVQCYIRTKDNMMFVTFRGSDSLRDWKTDLTFWRKSIPYDNTNPRIRVHTGFINAYKAPGVRDRIQSLVTDRIEKIRVCGHSYGAALTLLCAPDLQYHFPERDIEAVTFGGPRIGNEAFKKSYNKRVFKTLRVENGNDIVTKVPLMLWGFRHVGTRLHIGQPRIFGIYSCEQHRQQAYYQNIVSRFLP